MIHVLHRTFVCLHDSCKSGEFDVGLIGLCFSIIMPKLCRCFRPKYSRYSRYTPLICMGRHNPGIMNRHNRTNQKHNPISPSLTQVHTQVWNRCRSNVLRYVRHYAYRTQVVAQVANAGHAGCMTAQYSIHCVSTKHAPSSRVSTKIGSP